MTRKDSWEFVNCSRAKNCVLFADLNPTGGIKAKGGDIHVNPFNSNIQPNPQPEKTLFFHKRANVMKTEILKIFPKHVRSQQ